VCTAGCRVPRLRLAAHRRFDDLRGQADLNALAADAGTQLAGHFWTTSPEALRGYQRFTQLRAFELAEERARDLARSLSNEIVAEWRRFRADDVRH
jgi:hypothetical protein